MVSVAGKVDRPALAARIRLHRTNAESAPFSLDVSLEIPPGFTILFGPSGSGKSTFLDCIAGLLRPEEGQITFGQDALFDSTRNINLPPQARRIGYLFQSPALFPHLTVEENVAYGISRLPSSESRERAGEFLKRFHVESLAKRRPREISGGEKQRVALARSLATMPRALLLDEPLTGLEAGLKFAILEDLRLWNALQPIPIVYVTHNREEVDALGERVIAMEHGRVLSAGIPHEVLDAPRRQRLAQAVGFENMLDATVKDLRESDGVMRVQLGSSSSEIEVPLGYASSGDKVRVAVRAGDILLATERPTKLSARNIIEGTLAAIEERRATVVCRVDAGVPFLVHVTRGALRSLELTPGKRVWLVLKTHSCHLVEA